MVAVEAQAAGLPVLASTEVPRECAVVPELVRFKGLKLENQSGRLGYFSSPHNPGTLSAPTNRWSRPPSPLIILPGHSLGFTALVRCMINFVSNLPHNLRSGGFSALNTAAFGLLASSVWCTTPDRLTRR